MEQAPAKVILDFTFSLNKSIVETAYLTKYKQRKFKKNFKKNHSPEKKLTFIHDLPKLA